MANVLTRGGRFFAVVCCMCAILFLAGTVVAQELTGLEKLLKDAMEELLAKYEEINSSSLSEDQKKQALIDWAAAQRYGENQDIYFQFFNEDGTMVMDPASPDDIGKNFSEYRDNDETYVFKEFKQIAGGQPGTGFLDYMWPRPNGALQVSKKSFINTLKQYGWILCVGKYLETIEPYDLDPLPGEIPDPSGV